MTLLYAKDAPWTDLLDRVRDSHDEAAFADLFGYFAPRVKGFLIKSGASEGMAEECTQEVMAAVWNKAHLFDPSRATLATWIFGMARNRRVDLLRKQRHPEPEQIDWGPEEAPDQYDVVALQEASERLSEALSNLPGPQRDLIERAYYWELSHREIAEVTGLPLGTIKSRIRLGMDRLRHELT